METTAQAPWSKESGAGASRARFPEQAGTALRWAAALVAALYLGFALVQMSGRVAYPYQLDFYEGVLLHHAQTIEHGGLPYASSTTLPWVPHIYGPVYPALWAALIPIGGAESFWPGRVVAVVGLLLAAACLVLLVRRLSGQWLAALVAAGVFLWFPAVRDWTALARVDTVAVGLALAGFATFVLGPPRARVWGTLLFVLAVSTKQTMLAAPLAAYLALYFQGERRSAALHLALFFGLVLVAGASLQFASHGGFLRDTVLCPMNKWDWDRAHHNFTRFLMDGPLLLGVALALAVAALGDRRYRALGLYLFLALGVASTVGKVGSAPNYFLEPVAVAAVLLGLALGQAPLSRPGALVGATLMPALVLTQLALMWAPPTLSQPHGQWLGDSRLMELVRAQPGEVLSVHMGAVVQTGKTLWLEPFVATQMAEAGRWDQQPLLQMIREHRFGLVVMGKQRDGDLVGEWWGPEEWTAEGARTILSNYHITQVIGGRVQANSDLVLLEPNAPPGAPPPPRP